MTVSKQLAAVTGASGMVGRHIVQTLLKAGYTVRVLTRKPEYPIQSVDCFQGGLANGSTLKDFMSGVDLLFHCAAELHDENRMWAVNVEGTASVLAAARKADVSYFCHMSSVGVIGRTKSKIVDEQSDCSPQNNYEKSKYAAEQIVLAESPGMRIVILRPTNVVDDTQPGILSPLVHPSLRNRFKLILTGGELAHIVHAENVAAAAVYLIDQAIGSPECYHVSCDHLPGGSLAELNAAYRRIVNGVNPATAGATVYLPEIVSYILRIFLGRSSNRGTMRYSSQKLLNLGFQYPVDILSTIHRLAEANRV